MRGSRAAEPPASADLMETLVGNHRAFLRFLENRVGSRAEAEDILQEAFVKGMEHAGTLRAEESAVAWFYRTLRSQFRSLRALSGSTVTDAFIG